MTKHNSGWKKDSYRHSLAAKRVKTKNEVLIMRNNKVMGRVTLNPALTKKQLQYMDESLIDWAAANDYTQLEDEYLEPEDD